MFPSSKFVKFPIFVLFYLASIESIVKASEYHISGTIYCTTDEPVAINPADPQSPILVPPPLENVKMELWEEDNDRGAFLDPDDLIGETHTNKTGHFNVGGENTEIISEEPYLLITHKCQPENGDEQLNEGCSYISRIDLAEKGQNFNNMEIFLGANEVKLSGIKTKLEIKTEIKC